MFPLLSSADPTVLGTDMLVAYPVVLGLLVLAGGLAEARWRMGQAERRADKAETSTATLEARVSQLERYRAADAVILGRLEQMVTDLHKAQFQAHSRSA